MKKLLFILALFCSMLAVAQPGPVNRYYTRVRYWMSMADSLNGVPNDTFNLRTQRAISYGWNNYEWLARKNNVLYAWNVSRQRWEAQVSTTSQVSIINDSTLQICNANGCDTFNVNINPATITNVSIINDSTLLVCNVNSCDTQIFHTTGPPVTTTTILNDSTIIVCNANHCDTFVVHTTVVTSLTTTTILNDSTIEVCNVNSCDTLTINNPTPPITSTTIINDSTIIVCNNTVCDTLIVHQPITTTTVINDSTIQICTNSSCDTIVIHPPISSTTIINDSTIQICNTSGSCDTLVFSSQITNISVINDTTVQVCGSNILGPEQIINGGFVGSAGGWELGSLWAYDANDIVHSFGSTQPTAQSGGLVEGGTYRVTANIGGANGTVAIHLDAGTSQTYNAGSGAVTFTGVWNTANNYKIVLTPSNDFDGSITDISVRQILPNCDTIQTVPTVFRDTVHIFVESPLHARNDSTFYITRSTKQDSGFLSNDDFAYFWHKVDSLYFHPSPLGQDSFFYNNGDSIGVLWYINDVIANGVISGGQVLYSGTPGVYNVTPAVYRINGIRYTSPATQLTINPFDPSLPRTDVFYVDTSGNAGYLLGIAANPNLKPSIDRSWQLELTSLDIPAGSYPHIDTVILYNENIAAPTEWTPMTFNGTTGNANDAGPTWIGAKDFDITNINNAGQILFNEGATFDVSPYKSLNGFIKLKAVMPSTGTLRVVWKNAGTTISAMLTIPLNRSNTTTYQPFSIPLSSFGLVSNVVTTLQLQYVNTSGNITYLGFKGDYWYLQTGINTTPQGGNALVKVTRNAGTDSVMGTYQDGTVSYQFKDSSGITASAITADNGLTDSVNRIILGGTLYKNTTISQNSFTLDFTGSNAPSYNVGITGTGTAINLKVISDATNTAISGIGGSVGVNGQATSGHAIEGIATSGVGVYGQATTGVGGNLNVNPSSTNSVVTVAQIDRFSSGAAANGIGGSIDFRVQNTTGGVHTSNQIQSSWTDATTATRTSRFSITGVNSSTTQTLATADGNGAWTFPGNGTPGTTVTVINTTNSGLVVGTTSGTAIGATTTTGISGVFDVNPSSTNSVVTILNLERLTTGTAAAGLGGRVLFNLETTAGSVLAGTQLTSSWTDATFATATSKFSIDGYFNGSIVNLITVNGDGSWNIRPITATAASAITPSEGKFIFVSSTDATFTSIGPWCYYNGAWHAL